MVTAVSVLIGLPFVLTGLAFAFAGRDIHHKLISIFGFILGFSTVIIGFLPLFTEAWISGAWLGFLARSIVALIIAGLFGLLGVHWAWFVYRFSIEFPGGVAGAFLAVLLVRPVEGIDWLVLLGAFALGGHIAWRLHEMFLVINTSWLGSLLVGIGIAWTRLPSLPIIRTPGRLLTDPIEVLEATIAMIELVSFVVVIVFLLGLLVQSSEISVLGMLDNLLRGLPSPSLDGSISARRSVKEEDESRTVQKSQSTQQSVAPTSEPDDDSGFYEK
jgi:hypothetical protein